MNKQEITSSTANSFCESKDEGKVPNNKMVALLKLVYYERKSIKQSSKYLKINYNAAKRIIKNFRRNRISLDDENESKYESLIDELRSQKKEKENEKEIDKFSTINTNKADMMTSLIMNQVKQFDQQLRNLNDEINNNQSTLMYLMNCYKYIMLQRSVKS